MESILYTVEHRDDKWYLVEHVDDETFVICSFPDGFFKSMAYQAMQSVDFTSVAFGAMMMHALSEDLI